jgi:alpha-L-fucosidase
MFHRPLPGWVAAPPVGGWADASVSYTTTSADIGKVVSIQIGGSVFQNAYTAGNHNWRFFDNVRLTTVGAFPPVVITPYPTPVAAAPDPTDVFPYTNETAAQKNARMAWWREARFGMFIHWGLYSQLGGQYNGTNYSGNGEWTMWGLQIPEANYQAFAPQFNPTQFNATTWANIAKTAGMKYVVMTAKHHEGFAMYPSTASAFNIYDATPFKRDPVGEMNTATTTAGLKFGIYYSQNLDWNHPGGGMIFGPSWDPAQNGNYDTYISTVAAPQVQEVLSRYHPSVLWWDEPGAMSDTNYALLTANLASVPGLITNDRLGDGPYDFAVEEQAIPVGTLSTDWEECMTINDTWGYKTLDTDFKSSQTLLSNLINVVSKGGNYLLNVGPDSHGVIPQPEVDRLNDMGLWLSTNGESIYGATNSPYSVSGFTGYTTYQNNKLYLHVFSWPYESPITVTGIGKTVLSAKWLENGESLTVTTPGGNVTISEPTMLDPLCTTVVLTLAP